MLWSIYNTVKRLHASNGGNKYTDKQLLIVKLRIMYAKDRLEQDSSDTMKIAKKQLIQFIRKTQSVQPLSDICFMAKTPVPQLKTYLLIIAM